MHRNIRALCSAYPVHRYRTYALDLCRYAQYARNMSEIVDRSSMEALKEQLVVYLAGLQEKSASITAEIDRTKQQIELIERLLRVSDAGAAPKATATSGTGGATPSEVIRQILQEANAPLHISEILSRYVARGNRVPGKGTEANLLSYMVRDARFVRVAKGIYTLASGGTAYPSVAKQRTRKRRKRRKRTRRRVRPIETQLSEDKRSEE